MSLAYPLIAWGAPEDITAAPWATSGTPVVTGGQADPFGGTDATLIEDVSAGAAAYRRKDVVLSRDGDHDFGVFVKQGTSPTSRFIYSDTTLGVSRFSLQVTWASLNFQGLAGALLGAIAVGLGWWYVLGRALGVVTANNNQLRCYGSGTPAGDLGSTYWYLRNCALLEPPRRPVSWDGQLEGSEFYEALDGTADACLRAREYRFRGDIPHVPTLPRTVPQLVSGWDGVNEATGINAGVEAMLKAGQDARTLVFVPDRSLCSVNIPSELVHPVEGDETVPMPDGSRGFTLELRNLTTPYPGIL